MRALHFPCSRKTPPVFPCMENRSMAFQAILCFAAGSLAVRTYGKGDEGVLSKEDVIFRLQKAVLQHSDF